MDIDEDVPRYVLVNTVTLEKYHLLGTIKDGERVLLLRLSDNVKIVKSWKNVTEQLEKIGYWD